jgi:hypothetical protein
VSKSEWRKSTVWHRTMKGFPAGWLTIEKGQDGAFMWSLVLVDVDGIESKASAQLTFAAVEREALTAWRLAGDRLQRARGGA